MLLVTDPAVPVPPPSDTVQIVTVIVSMIGTCVTAICAVLMARLNRKADEAAVEVKKVETTLHHATEKHDSQMEMQAIKLDQVAAAVEVVHQQGNGIKDELVSEVRKASFAQGVKSETDKGPREIGPALPLSPPVVEKIIEQIAKVPEKTADKVIEKIKEQEKS